MSFHPNDVVRRARVATLIVAGLMTILLGAFFRTQVLQHEIALLHSEDNRLREIPITAPRGVIYDRVGKIIAENAVSYSVSLSWAAASGGASSIARSQDSLVATLGRLREIIALTSKDSSDAIRRFRNEFPRPTVILSDVTFDKISVLEEHRIDFPNLIMQPTPRRIYPAGSAVGAFVGYTGEVDQESLIKLQSAGYKSGQQIGKSGLEEQYEKVLRGREGSRFVEVDARNRVVLEEGAREDRAPIPGKDLHTNIDLDLQIFISKLFADSLVGGAVAMDPTTGGILALYSAPTYDPNRFVGGASSAFYDSLRDDPRRPLYNKALQGTYPPGSTFKLATAVIALEDSVATMTDKMPEPCIGYFYYGNRAWKCWKPEGHGSLDLAGAIEKSCDVYFYQLGLKIGLERLAAGGVRLGFTGTSGVDLPEVKPDWPDSYPKYFNDRFGARNWTQALALNLAIGQGQNAQSIIDMARFYTALATDGRAAQPQIALEAPKRTKLINLSPEQLAQLRQALVGVIASGTGASAAINGVVMGGKTGTAQTNKFVNGIELNDAWFVGFAPANDPKIVVAVMLEFGGHGTRAAQIASKIISQYLHAQANYLAETGGL